MTGDNESCESRLEGEGRIIWKSKHDKILAIGQVRAFCHQPVRGRENAMICSTRPNAGIIRAVPRRVTRKNDSFPRSAWECRPGRSASRIPTPSVEDGIPAEDRGIEKRAPAWDRPRTTMSGVDASENR